MINDILPLLNKVRQTKPNSWLACCPSHQDKQASLAITELPDGRVLLKCWAGCTAKQITHAVGLNLRVLYPQTDKPMQSHDMPEWERQKLLKDLQFEQIILAIFDSDISRGRAVSYENHERAIKAAQTISEINIKLDQSDAKVQKDTLMNTYSRSAKNTASGDHQEAKQVNA